MNHIPVSIVFSSVILIIILGIVGFIVQHRANKSREKSSAYECGFDPNISARIPFSLRFFLLAVIFLVFDVEIALLIGVPLTLRLNRLIATIRSTIFLIILVIGLFHEWREGSLNWM